MMVKLVDYRVSPAARRLAFLAAALALTGVLNVSGCSHQDATSVLARASSGTFATALVGSAAKTGARPAAAAVRELDPALGRTQMGDVFERFDHLPTGASS